MMLHKMMSHNGSHDKCGKVVHRPCSKCISSIQEMNEDSIYHKWSLTICDGCFDTLKSSKMQS